MKFLSSLWNHCVKPFPIAFVLFVIVVVLTLGGVTWWILGLLFAALRKVPGGEKVADAAEKGVEKVADLTKS